MAYANAGKCVNAGKCETAGEGEHNEVPGYSDQNARRQRIRSTTHAHTETRLTVQGLIAGETENERERAERK